MNSIPQKLTDLYNRIPRRHTADNVKDIYAIINEYENILIEIEAEPKYEKLVPPFFDELDPISALVKKSTDNKASKQQKDNYFDEASGALKDTLESLKELLLSLN